jgi:predicted DNA-binding transcriptional regulator YafY
MNRFDRILGILLFLRSGQSVTATALAQHFEVSVRTIYRDLEALSALDIPIYAERGREGGFRLLEGYFLPPLMFSTQEAISLLLGLTLRSRLQAQPFITEMETARKKLLAAVPDRLRSTLIEANKIIGFERLPGDIFHPELSGPAPVEAAQDMSGAAESGVVSLFLQAILDCMSVRLQYESPYQAKAKLFRVEPLGLFWDREHWYLAGRLPGQPEEPRLWRADRVLEIKHLRPHPSPQDPFDVRELLGRNWLKAAMERWRQDTPVKICLSPAQAERLQQDWYYRHAHFEPVAEQQILMTVGEDNPAVVLELLRWLGPGAELLEPRAWRTTLKEELKQMLAQYEDEELIAP